MKLACANDWISEKSAVFTNQDGFLKALQVLRDTHGWEVKYFKAAKETYEHEHDCVTLSLSPDPYQQIMDWKPDTILFFCDLSRPILKQFEGVNMPKALMFTGGGFRDYIQIPDIIFVESKSYEDDLKRCGARKVVRAFGTNTEMFKPTVQPKIFDAIFPATFAAWKRHNLFGESAKLSGSPDKWLACGYFQPHEMHCVQSCQNAGVTVLNHQIAESMNLLYNASRVCVITSENVGGSQRTVLEAMACNVPVIVMRDSDKTSEFVLDCGVGGIEEPSAHAIVKAVQQWKEEKVQTRDWILANYSEKIYAQKLKEGIESIC